MYTEDSVSNRQYDPGTFELQRMFAEMHQKYDTHICAMEVSSHSLALSRAEDISFDYSVFTNLTPDHMDFHKDFEDYYNAKKKLFLQTSKCSVINIDDPYGKRLFDELKAEGRPVKSCAAEDENEDYRALVREKSVSGTERRFSVTVKVWENFGSTRREPFRWKMRSAPRVRLWKQESRGKR